MKKISIGGVKINGVMNDYLDFVNEQQLKDRATWKRYTDAFLTKADNGDRRWRGEFWGKQMRGAVMVYMVNRDGELYEILTESVNDLLAAQDENGRISTYETENEFTGWDIWCRKYVLVGLLHYLSVCKDKSLYDKIKRACVRHLDYIVNKIFSENIDITKTSEWWGAVNSCTILEPVIEMYKLTADKNYLRFAEYIISTGGSSCCNLVELALKNVQPYKYPVTKAYELMSFYEGLLAYYEVTGKKKYFRAVDNFVEAIAGSDLTVIGCAGCTHELFDNSADRQTEYSDNIMQETCVTVTWMRLCRRMWLDTRNPKYIDRIEQSGFNALYGSINLNHCRQFELASGKSYAPKAFDSYSPLCCNSRGRGIGGFMNFPDGEYGGCCIAIGACGVALLPLSALDCDGNSVYVNIPFSGVAEIDGGKGGKTLLEFRSDYPRSDKFKITVRCGGERFIAFKIRAPRWCGGMLVNGKSKIADGYFEIKGKFNDGDVLEVCWRRELKKQTLNGKAAFTFGPIVLTLDSAKDPRGLEKPLCADVGCAYEILPACRNELLRLRCDFGGEKIILTDYQSCGKQWDGGDSKITVWFNTSAA